MSIIVYADFACPECYLAGRRADVLAAAKVPVDFRAVEHRPNLPIDGLLLSADDMDAVSARFEALRDLLLPGEELPWSRPNRAPKSEASVSAYAEAYGSPVESDVRRLLFDLYWHDSADIGDPKVLRSPLSGPMLRSGSTVDSVRQSGYAVSVDRGPISTTAYRRIQEWRAEWRELGFPALPVVLVDGATLHGMEALRRLGKEIGFVGAEIDPARPDPRRYPHVDVRPPPPWVSQIGGRWRNDYRPGGIAGLTR
ncbi:MAG: DsbA family protein [Jatrophihabitans sp.]